MVVPAQADQRAYLRRRVGHAEDTALVSDALLDDCLASGLRAVNQHFPLKGFGSFVTVANQQHYAPVPATGYALTKVFWPSGCDYIFPENVDSFLNQFLLSEVVDEYGTRRSYEPSILTGWYQNQEYFHRLFGNGGRIENQTTVYLDPVPQTDGVNVYFIFTKERYAAVTDVSDIHTEPYYTYALMCLHEALSVGRGALTSASSSGGVRMTTVAAAHHLRMSEEMRRRFHSYLPVIQPGRMWP